MDTDQVVKDILSQSFHKYNKKREKNEEQSSGYVAISEDITLNDGSGHVECVDINRIEKIIESDEIDQVFVESFEKLQQQQMRVIYGMTKQKGLVKVIYDAQIGFILAVGMSIYLNSMDAKEVSKKFCQLLY